MKLKKRYYKIRNWLRAYWLVFLLVLIAYTLGIFTYLIQKPDLTTELTGSSLNYGTLNERIDKINDIKYALNRSAVIDTIRHHEGFSSTPYDCYGDTTIGYGHVITSKDHFNKITEWQAYTILLKDFKYCEDYVYKTTKLTGKKRLAIAHFVYSLGSGSFFNSSLYNKVKNGGSIKNEILIWHHINGKDNINILKSRMFELNLYNETN
jgi:GH24 family phage-related lysozyme (muramidase)